MYENILNNLSKSKKDEVILEGEFIFKGNKVSVSVDPDGESIEETLNLASKFLKALDKYESKALEKVFQECFSMYNDNWREENEPILSKEEFLSNLTLTGINFLSTDSVDFFYSENGMFGNHSLIPQVFDGENFEYVQMYG